jgi:predicted short-subunit dehydrogenase-like oxidoreductase (DUF2520 family)
MMSCRFVFVGAGNLATRLSLEFKKKGFIIEQVYSRTESSAKALALQVNANFTSDPGHIAKNADVYFVALKDSVIHEVLPLIDFNNSLIVHCSGSLPLSELERYSVNTGVFYPLQTFSKNRDVNFDHIPVFIESESEANLAFLQKMAGKISVNVMVLDSEKRVHLHIAAVFACNFVNRMYAIASDILKARDIDFNLLHPWILETAMKVQEMAPRNAQTGPAVRYDKQIIDVHIEKLQEFVDLKELYELISKNIYQHHK